MSRPLSVSSRMASFGSSIAIWKISLRFFSPPEKPTLTARCSRSSPMSSSLQLGPHRRAGTGRRRARARRGAGATALSAVRRKYMLFTPGISTGYWNARNTPVARPLVRRQRQQVAAVVAHAPCGHLVAVAPGQHRGERDLPEPFGPMIACTSPARDREVDALQDLAPVIGELRVQIVDFEHRLASRRPAKAGPGAPRVAPVASLRGQGGNRLLSRRCLRG